MSEDKFENTNGSKGLSETDKGYYEDLYNDLPKEVVDILMQTHPLMGKNDDLEATAYRARRPQRREDVEEVREARMQQVKSEINEVSRAPQQEGEPTRYVSRRARNSGIVSEEENISGTMGNTMNQENYDDGIQYVSVIPARKKSKIVEEVTLQTTAAPQKKGKRSKREREPMPFEDMGRDARDNRPRYEDLDFEERAKQEHLDSLYEDDYDDEDYGRGRGKLAIVLGIVGLILIIFLIFRTVSLNSELEEVQNKLTQSEEYKTKYEDIQLEKMQLEEELENLKNPDGAKKETDDEKKDEEKTDDKKDSSSASSGSTTEYTVQQGDTMWTIAQKTLGNGAEYQKILDANGLKESDTLKPGSKIKIPKA